MANPTANHWSKGPCFLDLAAEEMRRLDRAEAVARQISRSLEGVQAAAGFPLPTVSYGVAPLGSGDLDAVIASANAALYEAKAQGGNRVVLAG